MKIINIDKYNTNKLIMNALNILGSGGIIIYPTETCYGIGVDATNKEAVKNLLKYKQRPEGKAISIAVSNINMAREYVDINKTAENIYKNLLPGPLTVISNSRGKVAKKLEAEDKSLGVRMPKYQLVLKIIRLFGKPITATSANISNKRTPYSIDDILKNTTKKQQALINLVLDAGRLPKNPPSTVVDTRMNDERVLRKGQLDIKSIIQKNKKTKKHSYVTKSEDETQKVGFKIMNRKINNLYTKCIIFALQGELGAGKTQFAKGIGRALCINEIISSPTYTLVKEYEYKVNSKLSNVNGQMFHVDTWRMRDLIELNDLGFKAMLKPGNIIIIEWLQKVKSIIDETDKIKNVNVVWVDIKYKSKKERIVKLLHS